MTLCCLRLLVPLCGYAGAQQRNRKLLSCFTGWSMGCGVCGGVSAFFMLIYMFTGMPKRNPDGTDDVVEVPVAIGLVNILFGVMQAMIYYVQYRWGRELAEEPTLFAHTPEPEPAVYDIEIQTTRPVVAAVPAYAVHVDSQMAATAHADCTKPPEYDDDSHDTVPESKAPTDGVVCNVTDPNDRSNMG